MHTLTHTGGARVLLWYPHHALRNDTVRILRKHLSLKPGREASVEQNPSMPRPSISILSTVKGRSPLQYLVMAFQAKNG